MKNNKRPQILASNGWAKKKDSSDRVYLFKKNFIIHALSFSGSSRKGDCVHYWLAKKSIRHGVDVVGVFRKLASAKKVAELIIKG